jgi:hypothetical protein
MLTVYRVVYGLVLALLLGNVIMAGKDQHISLETSLLIVAGLMLLAILGLVFRFSRIPPAAFWVLVLGWEVLFVWYAWFSSVAPFVYHEAHALDAGGAANEATAHYVKAGILFGLLFLWFLSLPFARAKWKNKTAHLPHIYDANRVRL